MPAKRKRLPHPCPKCGRDNGTVQLVYFEKRYDFVIRIGHYNSKRYNATVKESKKIENFSNQQKKRRFEKNKKSHQRAWCGFRLSWSYETHRLENKLEKICERENKTTKTIPLPWSLKQQIKKDGWDIKPEDPSKYRGRVHKNIDYYENIFSSK